MSGFRGNDPHTRARLAVQLRPADAMAWTELSDLELDAGDAAAGIHAARRALELAPGHPEPLARLGRAYWMQGRYVEAVGHLRAAVTGAPGHPGIAVWLAHVLEEIGDAEEAAELYASAYAVFPHPQVAAHLLACRRRLCDWRDLDGLSAMIAESVRMHDGVVEPFAYLSEDGDAPAQLACASARARVVEEQVVRMPTGDRAHAADLVRLGFISNGFGAHPTGLLTVALFEALSSRQDVDVHLFALNGDDASTIRRRLESAATLHDVSRAPNGVVAQAIRNAGIEVLFDLRGWGGGGRPEILAARPAPVQVNWLAYPGTSGATWIDYIVADQTVLPPSDTDSFSEAVAWLPRCFQPSDTTRVVPPAPSRAECGLPEEGVVYCCFNNSYKLNPKSFHRILDVLRGVPGSVAWLLSGPGSANARLRASASRAGIEPSRLVFMSKRPHAAYLARLRLADLFLDCNPYNAHTTASDALWAGCPVLTCPGRTFASRVVASLNHHLGLEHLNTADDAAFISLATSIGRSPTSLKELRNRLANLRMTSSVFDMEGFASDLVSIIHRMVERQRLGQSPASLP